MAKEKWTPDCAFGEQGQNGRLLLSTTYTKPTATAFLEEHFSHPEGRLLHCYGGVFYHWDKGRYEPVEEAAVKLLLDDWLEGATVPGDDGPVPFPLNTGNIEKALGHVYVRTHLPETTPSPSWLSEDSSHPFATDILSCKSCLLHIPSGKRLGHTPIFFTTSALEFDYEPNAPEPKRWLSFLNELFGNDAEAIRLLQEWFGYALTPDTRQQKAFLIVGPMRSGKGTIARVLSALVGESNVGNPTTDGLASDFGLQGLIGKSLAIISDARFRGQGVNKLVERILCITGEDPISIRRKYLGDIRVKLPTRLVFLSNELPSFNETSRALANRFLTLRLTRSFFGCEDQRLFDKLAKELPGILLWALEGWKRLRKRGRFVLPKSSEEMTEILEELSSPVSAFIGDCCEIGPFRVNCDVLYREWEAWNIRSHTEHYSNRVHFGRDLRAAVPSIKRRQNRHENFRFYEGVRLCLPKGK